MDKEKIDKQKENLNITKELIERKLKGVVISDKMNKTLVVRVDGVKVHPKYKKRYVFSKKYKVHDEENKHKEGDNVVFVACRPLSKEKRWRVLPN